MKKLMVLALVTVLILMCVPAAYARSEKLATINELIRDIELTYTSDSTAVSCVYSDKADALFLQVSYNALSDAHWEKIRADQASLIELYDICGGLAEIFVGILSESGLSDVEAITIVTTSDRTPVALFYNDVNVGALFSD